MANELQYWDTCLFLRYLIEPPKNPKEQEQLEHVEALMQQAVKGELLIVVSTLVLAEIRPRAAYNARHEREVEDLFYRGRRNVKVQNVTPPIAALASRWGGSHNDLTAPDAVHVATALLEGASVMYTFDGDVDKERNRSHKLLAFNGRLSDGARGPLKIEVPPTPPAPEAVQRSMFDSGPLDESEQSGLAH